MNGTWVTSVTSSLTVIVLVAIAQQIRKMRTRFSKWNKEHEFLMTTVQANTSAIKSIVDRMGPV